jgi:hypothetical protein
MVTLSKSTMTQEHFNYEGSAKLHAPKPDIEILDIEFLTPARIKAKVNGQEAIFTAGVDIINRRVYIGNDESFIGDHVFNYLDSINTLPEDFFAAPQEVVNEVQKAESDLDAIKQEVNNG